MKKNKIITIGPVIKRLRLSNQLSQEELADLCNLDTSFISKIEGDKQIPSLNSLMALANVFDLYTWELVKLVEEYNEPL